MSKRLKQQTVDHYNQLCAAHGIRPTVPQIQRIKQVAGDVAKNVAERFEYGLLYFLLKSAVVMEDGHMLVGWVNKPGGLRRELWFEYLANRGHLYEGRTPLYHADPEAPFCDEWHPSLDELCKQWQTGGLSNRHMLFALLGAAVRIMKADVQTPCIADSIATPAMAKSGQRDTTIETQNVLAESSLRREPRSEKAPTDGQPRNTPTTPTVQAHSSEQNCTKVASQSVVVDLTESDSEGCSKIRILPTPPTTDRIECERTTSAKEELIFMLQCKRVSEIEVMLAQRSGQLPDWIERVMREEMEKKMVCDLDMVRNLF
ncbi:unnamed protein product [Aureobasidium mustum]|uniref:Uncharacterized protein n=1 Tax=Aureobasidium mustum TaxID=2773714 RepID=A0A9N8PIG4_9PEZI|nr:unnamed protein product [Aureobasidium mustum]